VRRRTIWSALAVLTASLVAVEAAAPAVRAATVPAGFSDASVAKLSSSTAIEWLPGNRIVVLGKLGQIWVARPSGSFTTAIDLSVCASSERGLLGLAPDPGFLGNGWVYVYYTRVSGSTCVNRVSRFTMIGDSIVPSTEVVLLDNIASTGGNHNGGDVDVGSDGYLYVAVGDAGRDPRGNSGSGGSNDAAQDLSLLNGKILRITRDGFPAPGNPISGPGTTRCAFRGGHAGTPTTRCQELFAWGLRNPYRFAFDHNDGSDRFFINDVGQRTFEEVNEGLIGSNYGWPEREGCAPQGQTTCGPPPAQYTDPLTAYGRTLGWSITAGAFVPNGLWPVAYDGAYLFGDWGTGNIFLRDAAGIVDYDEPFATGASRIVDMTFGFDAEGSMVLYYASSGGDVRVITPTSKTLAPVSNNLKLTPVTPFRAYDTADGTGVAAGAWFNGTTRLVDLDPPADTRAALVNLTYAATSGPGFLRAWSTRGPRPDTSALNADRPFSFVANAAVVPLAADGSFVLESATTGRVIIDVMGWFQTTGGTSVEGRFVASDPARLADTREPAGVPLDSGSSNPWTRASDRIDVGVLGEVGVPDDGTVGAIVISVGAVAGAGPAGYVGVYPGGGTYSGTSNVNVLAGDIRANMMVIPLDGADHVSLRTLNIAHVVVDVLGYVTTDSPLLAPSTAGLYHIIDQVRIADTREGTPFGRLQPLLTRRLDTPEAGTSSAVVQNVTVTRTAAPGWVAAHTTAGDVPDVSTVNFTAADQTRAALAFTSVQPDGSAYVTSLVDTDLVVDVVGIFSD
jgi:glucose/arabinose dehydrogenase